MSCRARDLQEKMSPSLVPPYTRSSMLVCPFSNASLHDNIEERKERGERSRVGFLGLKHGLIHYDLIFVLP